MHTATRCAEACQVSPAEASLLLLQLDIITTAA
jgi:hypothetical protein